ncbi:recombinase family protein [Bacillus sp. AFS017336]|uniref:recombinase family protein n=1 Tax=Bacillus sp. AFS017336 TaxID=2033489 RepID=UPI00211D5986|nr:recombinase family protein [Bacillus sp. AFS017336]
MSIVEKSKINNSIKHVAIYLRISQEKKGENADTLFNHRTILTEFAKECGWEFELYQEVLSGGKSELSERPQLQRMLKEIELYDGILVVELSRLSRNGLISEKVLQTCVDYNKPIITRERIYDLANSQSDVLMYRFGSLIASQEHSLIGARSKNNKLSMVKQGMHVSGTVPFGYKRNKNTKRLEIEEKNAEIIRYIFKLHNEGLGSYRIRDILNAEGYKSATGKAFNLPSIKRIIRNPAYKGTVVFNDRKRVKQNGKYVYVNVNTIEVENAHPKIVTAADWEKANGIRDARAETANINRERPSSVTGVTRLKDLCFCYNCGRKLVICKNNRNASYYIKGCEYLMDDGTKCPNIGINAIYVEELVMQEVGKLRDEIELEIERLLNNDTTDLTTNLEEQLVHLNGKIEEQTKQFNKLIELAISGVFTVNEIASKKEAITDTIEFLKAEHEELTVRLANTHSASDTEKLSNVLTVLDEIEKGNADPIEINMHLKRFIRKIYYKRMLDSDLQNLSPNNPIRRNAPFTIEIEYI